jgi:hypothetical protein
MQSSLNRSIAPTSETAPEIVTLRNSQGLRLHCMLRRATVTGPRAGLACLLLSPGVKMRVAPHRLYRKLEDEFLQRGISVMRVDFHGLGDSDGDLPEQQLDQLYRQVQLGRHVEDVRAAMDWMAEQSIANRFIVGGLCGGALTGLLAAEGDSRVVALYALGLPVALDGSGVPGAAVMTRGQLNDMRRTYLRKLLDPASWWRFLAARSDYRTIFRALLAALNLDRLRPRRTQTIQQVPPAEKPLAADLNLACVRAMFSLLQAGSPALLLFSGADRLQWEFEEKFRQPWENALQKFSRQLEVQVIAAANHILSDPAWIATARRMTGDWLQARFG